MLGGGLGTRLGEGLGTRLGGGLGTRLGEGLGTRLGGGLGTRLITASTLYSPPLHGEVSSMATASPVPDPHLYRKVKGV